MGISVVSGSEANRCPSIVRVPPSSAVSLSVGFRCCRSVAHCSSTSSRFPRRCRKSREANRCPFFVRVPPAFAVSLLSFLALSSCRAPCFDVLSTFVLGAVVLSRTVLQPPLEYQSPTHFETRGSYSYSQRACFEMFVLNLWH